MEKHQIYLEKAEAAARAERFGNYAQAADLWNKATSSAPTGKQKAWCEKRCEFCERVAEKPF